MNRLFWIRLLGLFGFLLVSAAAQAASDLQTIQIGQETRYYRLHLPKPMPTNALALVLNFHGLGSSAEEQETLSAFSTLADQQGFIVVYPQARPTRFGISHWHTKPDEDWHAELSFTQELLQRLQQTYRIDAQRIYLTGLSNGAGMANLLAIQMGERIAALATVAGAFYNLDAWQARSPLPVLAVHGTADKIVPFAGRDPLAGVMQWVNFWVKTNRAVAKPLTIYQQNEILGQVWPGEPEVQLFTIQGKGHTWPGSATMPKRLTSQNLDASALIWRFFRAHKSPIVAN
ncbi:MAG: hypothetical protein JXR44_07625 [Thiotrichales bacterium]|nr:hypothetical protein [Thiotrichales bacterium]